MRRPARGGPCHAGGFVAFSSERPRFVGRAAQVARRACLGTAGSPAQGRPLHGAKGYPQPSRAFGLVQVG